MHAVLFACTLWFLELKKNASPYVTGTKKLPKRKRPSNAFKIADIMKNKSLEILTLAITKMAPVSFSSQTDTNISGSILKWWKNENKLIIRLDKMILSEQIFLDVSLPKHKARFGLKIIETLGNKADHVCKIIGLDTSEKNDGLILRDGVKIGIPTTTLLMRSDGKEDSIFAQCKLLNMKKNEATFDTENFDVLELENSNFSTFGVFFDCIKVGEFVGTSIEKTSMSQYKILGIAKIGSMDEITYNQDELAEVIEDKFNKLVSDEVVV